MHHAQVTTVLELHIHIYICVCTYVTPLSDTHNQENVVSHFTGCRSKRRYHSWYHSGDRRSLRPDGWRRLCNVSIGYTYTTRIVFLFDTRSGQSAYYPCVRRKVLHEMTEKQSWIIGLEDIIFKTKGGSTPGLMVIPTTIQSREPYKATQSLVSRIARHIHTYVLCDREPKRLSDPP